VAAATLDEDAHEVYIADGYLNRRVLVYDWDTGKFKRGWGAYGKALAEIDNNPQPAHDPKGMPAKDFKSPVHCVRIAKDGLVYVLDRNTGASIFPIDEKPTPVNGLPGEHPAATSPVAGGALPFFGPRRAASDFPALPAPKN